MLLLENSICPTGSNVVVSATFFPTFYSGSVGRITDGIADKVELLFPIATRNFEKPTSKTKQIREEYLNSDLTGRLTDVSNLLINNFIQRSSRFSVV
jgi:hypothetical protein